MTTRSPSRTLVNDCDNNESASTRTTWSQIFGTERPDRFSKVCNFMFKQACKIKKREHMPVRNAEICQTIIECWKLRLLAAAYTRIEELDRQCAQFKRWYLKTVLKNRRRVLTKWGRKFLTASRIFARQQVRSENRAKWSHYKNWAEMAKREQ